MHSKRAGWLALATAVAAAGCARGRARRRGDRWNINANAAIFATTPTAHASTLSFAMVQGAVYDAVNAIAGGYRPISSSRGPTRGTPRMLPPRLRRSASSWPSFPPLRRPRLRPSRRSTTLRSRRSRRAGEGRAGSRSAKRRRRDARGPGERRPQPDVAVPVRLRHDPGRVARVAAAFGARSDTVGRQRDAVPGPERRDAPHARAERAHEQRVRADFNEVKSLGSLTSTTRTADQTMAAIFWQSQPTGSTAA